METAPKRVPEASPREVQKRSRAHRHHRVRHAIAEAHGVGRVEPGRCADHAEDLGVEADAIVEQQRVVGVGVDEVATWFLRIVKNGPVEGPLGDPSFTI
jgi:hypothetical protein